MISCDESDKSLKNESIQQYVKIFDFVHKWDAEKDARWCIWNPSNDIKNALNSLPILFPKSSLDTTSFIQDPANTLKWLIQQTKYQMNELVQILDSCFRKWNQITGVVVGNNLLPNIIIGETPFSIQGKPFYYILSSIQKSIMYNLVGFFTASEINELQSFECIFGAPAPPLSLFCSKGSRLCKYRAACQENKCTYFHTDKENRIINMRLEHDRPYVKVKLCVPFLTGTCTRDADDCFAAHGTSDGWCSICHFAGHLRTNCPYLQ